MNMDYIIAGDPGDLSSWFENAKASGILRCRFGMEHNCFESSQCGIKDQHASLDVLVLREAPNFDATGHEGLLLLTGKTRRNGSRDDQLALAKAFTRSFANMSVSLYVCDEKGNWENVDLQDERKGT